MRYLVISVCGAIVTVVVHGTVADQWAAHWIAVLGACVVVAVDAMVGHSYCPEETLEDGDE